MYKPSNYNFIWPLSEEERFLVYNSFTTACVCTDQSGVAILSSATVDIRELDYQDKDTVSEFITNGFLIEKEIDELKVLKFSSNTFKYNKDILSLTIAPTMACNFSCEYCYQEPGKQVTMSKEVQEGILHYIENSIKKLDKLYITWFGGEPLLAKSIISELSERIDQLAKAHDCEVSYFMITNGSLFDPPLIAELKEHNYKGIQITLDGPPGIHNKRRRPKNGDEHCFEHIMDNIKELLKNGMKVMIRINLDKTNADSMEKLLDLLKEEGVTEAIIDPAQVVAYTEACNSVAGNCFTTAEYTEQENNIHRLLMEKGFVGDATGFLPKRKTNFCCADQINSFLIDPQGNMYKCWNHIGTKETVGNIINSSTRIQKMRQVNWIDYSPFDYKECVDCKYLPLCMGGCPYLGMEINHGKPECLKTKYNLQQIIMSHYESRKNKVEK